MQWIILKLSANHFGSAVHGLQGQNRVQVPQDTHGQPPRRTGLSEHSPVSLVDPRTKRLQKLLESRCWKEVKETHHQEG